MSGRSLPPLRLALAAVLTLGLALAAIHAAGPQRPARAPSVAVGSASGLRTLAFEPAAGRFGRDVQFIARRGGYALGLMRDGSTVLDAGRTRLTTRLIGARPPATGRPESRLPGIVNSYVGNDRRRWRTGLPTFGAVRYGAVYPGIDLRYHGREGQLEYDYIVRPAGDPGRIAMRITGGTPKLTAAGDLRIGSLRQRRPVAYQDIDGRRVYVPASFELEHGRVAFRVGDYDHRHTLVIDPQLLFSTYVGGTQTDALTEAELVQTNGDSFLMIGGNTRSPSFHGSNQNQDSSHSSDDVWVSKLSADGSTILVTTFFGGPGNDGLSGMTFGAGRLFLTGGTSGGMPIDASLVTPFDPNYTAGDSWIGRLSPTDLSIDVITYFAGTSGAGIVYTNFTVAVGGTESTAGLATTGAYDETLSGFDDAYASSFNIALTQQKWATYLGSATSGFGGQGQDVALAIGVDDFSEIYLAGYTIAPADFPIKTDANPVHNDGSSSNTDAFLSKISADGTALDFSRMYGGAGDDYAEALFVQPGTAPFAPHAIIGGYTSSTSLPGIAGPTPPAGPYNGFFSDLATDSTTTFGGAFIGGTGADDVSHIWKDGYGEIYLAGDTTSTDFPTVNPLQAQNAGGQDAFLIKRGGGGAATAFSTYLGGSGNEDVKDLVVTPATPNEAHPPATGKAYVVGSTASNNLGATALYSESAPTPVQPDNAGGQDGFVARVQPLSAKITGGPAEGSTDPSATANFTLGPALEPSASFQCSLDSAAYAACSATPSFPGLSDGPHKLQARYDDPFGLTDGTVATRNWTVDATPPQAFALQTPADAATVFTTPTFTWDDTSDALSPPITHELWIDGSKRAEAPACVNGDCSATVAAALAGGAHTWQARAVDAVGNVRASATRGFTVDATGPAAATLVGPVGGAELASAKPTLSWNATSDAGIGLAEYDVELDGRALGLHLSTSTLSFTPSDPLAEGAHDWRVIATDQFGNSTKSEAGKFRVDLTPPSAQLTASPNPMLAGRTVTLDASASSDPAGGHITHYEWDLDGDGTFETDGGTTPTITKVFNASGTYLLGVRVTDTVGQTRVAAATLIVTTPPVPQGQLGVTINNGAQYTKTPDVTLDLKFPSTTTQLLVSNDGGFLAPTTFAPKAQVDWKLDSSGPERLPKTVYVRFLLSGIVSETYTDDIILDEIPPVVEQASVTPAPTTAARAAKLSSFKVKLKATDTNSGVDAVQITAKKSSPGRFLKYKTSLNVKAATRKLFVRARDRAGNLSAWKKAR